jgi:thiol:disulfide interchange protein DsbA
MKLRLLLALAVVFAVGCSDSSGPATSSPSAPPAATPSSSPVAEATPAAAAEEAAVAARTQSAAAGDATAALAALGYQNGVHYVRLSPAQPTSSSPDQVEIAEFFMYSCIHCYNFEPYVQQWLMSKPDYVNFVRVPTVWNPTVRLHAQAFYAAEALGKGEEMHAPFFSEMHERNNYLQSEDAIAAFFAKFGVSREEFDKAFDSFSVHAKLQRADELARRYQVDSTPTIVVNGKYRTNASMAGGYDKLLELMNALAASEHSMN